MGIRFPLNVLQVIAVVFASTMCVEAYSQSVNAQTSVCQIMEHPEKKVPRQVEVDADLYNVMPHGIYLGDQHCSKRLLQIDFHVENADASVVELHKFISSSMKHGPLIAGGRFSGMLMRDSSSRRLYLMVKSVKNLQAKGWTPEASDIPPSVDVPDTLLHESGHADPPKPQ
jgi:hypothetical protein